MYTWKIYLEEADGDEPKRYLGTMQALQSDILQLASEYYEIPSHDLVVEVVPDQQGEGEKQS